MKSILLALIFFLAQSCLISCQTVNGDYSSAAMAWAHKYFRAVRINDQGDVVQLFTGNPWDVSMLVNFPKLEVLGLQDSGGDLSPISKLHNLKVLDFDGISNSKLNFLKSLKNLQELSLIGADNLNSLTEIGSLKKLVSLYINARKIKSLASLKHLHNLKSLELLDCPVSDLSPLGDISSLESISIYSDNNITDLTPLGKLKNLRFLGLPFRGIADISPLIGCPNLEVLRLGADGIKNIMPLAKLKKLVDLGVEVKKDQEQDLFKVMTQLHNLRTFYFSYQVQKDVYKHFGW